MEKRPCKNCRRLFTAIPQRPDQQYCSLKKCQRARKNAWQKEKMRTDPTYRQNQQDAQERWRKKNPHYHRNYRETHPEYTRRNRAAQADRNRKNRQNENQASIFDAIAKMDVSKDENTIKPGNYTLISAEDPEIVKMDVIILVNPSKSNSYNESSVKT